MKKYVISLIAGLLISLDSPAQGFLNSLNKALNGLTQGSQQRNGQRNGSQQTYQNRQRNEQQERANQQKRDEQQREYMQQQQRSRVNDEDSGNEATVRPDANNTTQGNDKVVSLVVNGTGSTKEEATKNALRSAIEQAFGTFVSSNTAVLDDELIKDEIVTVPTGNIKSYKVLSSSQSSSGLYDVAVQAIVSIDQLTKFAQSKGMQTELAGASFVMNMKMRELNKKNEVAAIEHMIEKAMAIAQNGLFDYELEIGEPTLMKNTQYAIKLTIRFCENANTKVFYETVYNTLQALSLTEKERQEYSNAGLEFYWYNKQLEPLYGNYALRNRYPVYWRGNSFTRLLPIIVENALDYVILDNLGNQITCKRKKAEPTTSANPLLDYISQGNGTCEWYYIDKENKILRFYELWPKDRIARVNHGYDKYPAIPLMDFTGRVGMGYNGIGTDVSFNPAIDGNKKIYYCQEFFVLYSEAELSKLTSIKIDHRQ